MNTFERLSQMMSLLDVTRLQQPDSEEQMHRWLLPIAESGFRPAAICLYSEYLPLIANYPALVSSKVAAATVVNFPSGQQSADQVCLDIAAALSSGASEIDCVLPYQELMAGRIGGVKSFLLDVRQACGTALLKVIIESGELITCQQVAKATELVIDSGADFVKSSTGKVPVGLTDEAAEVMLTVIAGADRPVGFKASGGVRTIEHGLAFMQQFERITGRQAQPQTMRLGASTLFQELCNRLQSKT
ncbi:deoxyribose-phosphate aldolase [Alkalimonas sp.]|uniref:deoxyribose-phosphate aldolase n=1 Tax=Alkalimonas sp. TaxID=1872453 RepID=UPI00263B3B77|nr:deoxyribose-phosphate aldolase [Alkalimonas sp.]MCC5824762.1 deoxyribose-phosphate aldolase [Alkalimonas sp.]